MNEFFDLFLQIFGCLLAIDSLMILLALAWPRKKP